MTTWPKGSGEQRGVDDDVGVGEQPRDVVDEPRSTSGRHDPRAAASGREAAA